MKWMLLLVVALVVTTILRRLIKRDGVLSPDAVGLLDQYMQRLPKCGLQLGNGSDVQARIFKIVQSGISRDSLQWTMVNKVRKLVQDQLDWPAWDGWMQYASEHTHEFRGLPAWSVFFEEDRRDFNAKIDAYVSTVCALLQSERRLADMERLGFRKVMVICPEGSCCKICQGVNGMIIPVAEFRRNFPFHPACNAGPGVDETELAS